MAGFPARPAEQTVSPFWPLPNDPVAVSAIALACVSALRGEPRRPAPGAEALRRAEDIGFPRGPFSPAFVTVFAAWIRRFTGDDEASWRLGAEAVAIGQEHGYVFWTTLGTAYSPPDPPGSAAHREHCGDDRRAAPHGPGVLHRGPPRLPRAPARGGPATSSGPCASSPRRWTSCTRPVSSCTCPSCSASGRPTRPPGGRPDEAAAELAEAAAVAIEQGALVARVRARVELAGLPAAARPDAGARCSPTRGPTCPPSPATEDTAAADALLAS